jgi:hypothetical protein
VKTRLKAKKNNAGGIRCTEQDARFFQIAIDALDGLYGDEAQDYFRRLAKLLPQYLRLIDKGVNVRFARHRFGRRPMLIIEK